MTAPQTGPTAPSGDARTRLAAAVRRLGHVSLDRDLSEDRLRNLAATVEGLGDDVAGAASRPRDADAWMRRFFTEVADGDELVHFADCVVSGPHNPLGIGLRAYADGDEVVSEVVLDRAHEGAPGRAHGGVVAALFDDALSYLLTVHGIVAFTGELHVRYVAGTPIGVPITIRSHVVERDGRRTILAAEARVQGELVATATGVFVSVHPYGSPVMDA